MSELSKSLMGLCISVVIIFIPMIMFAVWAMRRSDQKHKNFKKTKLAYETSLEQFKNDPGNKELRQETIQLGQEYAKLALARKSRLFTFSKAILLADITKIDYEYSITRLKSSPNNPDLRQKALRVGRKYARVVREDGRETLFDEMALMNDINAVSGGAVTNSKQTASQRLHHLQELKEQGLITEDEYNEKRLVILDEM